MELFKKIERLSAEQLLSVIQEFDREEYSPLCDICPSYERITFFVQNQEELAYLVEEWAKKNLDEYSNGFVYEYNGPGVYAMTVPQDGAYEMKRVLTIGVDVIGGFMHTAEIAEEIEDYIDRMCLYCTDPGHSAEYPFCDDHMNLGMGYECPDCGKETQPEYAYCPFCGYDLGGHRTTLP